jgi:hypothetical protein
MLPIALAVCLSPGAPIPPPRSRPTYDSAVMTREQAHELAGKPIRVRANIADPDDEYAENHNGDDNLRGIALRRGEATCDDGEMLVEGRLSVRYIPAHFINGECVEGFYSLRLEAARPPALRGLARPAVFPPFFVPRCCRPSAASFSNGITTPWQPSASSTLSGFRSSRSGSRPASPRGALGSRAPR